MSTTFDVYPRNVELPSFGAAIDTATGELHRFLDRYGISQRPKIAVLLKRMVDHSDISVSLNDPMRWERGVYAWFNVGNVNGGTDANFDEDVDGLKNRWTSKELKEPRFKSVLPILSECERAGFSWSFRRSASQPAIVNLTYGLLAGSLARITGGFVDSMDSAWDYDRLPAMGEEFLGMYFRPELATDKKSRAWSERCIEAIRGELK